MTHPTIQALLSLPPADCPGLALLERLLAEPLNVDQQLALGPEFEEAVGQVEALASSSRKVTGRCLTLKPAPSIKPPTGF